MEKPFCVNWDFIVNSVGEPFKIVSSRVKWSDLPFYKDHSGLCREQEQRTIQGSNAGA